MTKPRLLVFSDDWGRHPSSCQHLIRAMLPDVDVTWVNTIGMRPPRLDRITVQRGAEKIRGWFHRHPDGHKANGVLPAGLTVMDAKMLPWMTHRWDRWLNNKLLRWQLVRAATDATVITTIPIVADLVESLPAKRWVYYCVDDFSVWPGLDGKTLGSMEDELLPQVDCIVSASENLAQGIRARGFNSEVITHGVDLEFWQSGRACQHSLLDNIDGPIALFWGVVDRRMNAEWILTLADQTEVGRVALVGPIQDADPRLDAHPNILLTGPLPYEQLPALAAKAAVLIMPYADMPVTRAMQPLKFKEYLATARPVVTAALPAVTAWSDGADVVDNEQAFVDATISHLHCSRPKGPVSPLFDRLATESWKRKAKLFEKMVLE